jgi:hypothetical protein
MPGEAFAPQFPKGVIHMGRLGTKARLFLWTAVLGAGAAGLTGSGRLKADDTNADAAGKKERCAVRVSVGLLGTSPSGALLGGGDPQSQVDAILATPEFVERFARFVNAKFNDEPGMTSAEDASYHLAKHVLTMKRPWKDLFVGGFDVAAGANNGPVAVTDNAQGLGYFRSREWMVRYAGNELQGIKIVHAYRMMNNIIGLKMIATTNAPGADVSAAGRQAPACAGCHYNGAFALDNVAEVLGRVTRNGNNVTFQPYTGAAKALFAGAAQVKDDKELAQALVASENFAYNACALAFEYAYGRRENVCEAPVFDKCVSAFKASGNIQDGLAAIAKDATYCQ